MDTVNDDAQLLSDAIVAWVGLSGRSLPARNERLVVQEFGADVAADLMPLVLELYEEFYSSDARFKVADLKEMGEVAASQFRTRHPEISEEAVNVLKWCYMFDYK